MNAVNGSWSIRVMNLLNIDKNRIIEIRRAIAIWTLKNSQTFMKKPRNGQRKPSEILK